MFEKAVQTLAVYGHSSLLAKLDLQDAFHQIPVRKSDWHLLGFEWDSSFYYSVVLSFGLKSAPYIFNLFAEALHWIIQCHIPTSIQHYLDNFLSIFKPSTPVTIANKAVAWIQGLGEQLGLVFQHEKTAWPATSIEFLGIELDSIAMEACLPVDKLHYLTDLLQSWANRSSCQLVELQQLIGFLQFASQVIPHSRAFLRRLIVFSSSFKNKFSKRRLPIAVQREIHWWIVYSTHWNGIRLIQSAYPTIHVYTDASGTKGLGGIFEAEWFSTCIPRRFRDRDIQFKELYAVLQAIS